jgi:hypothetical protein
MTDNNAPFEIKINPRGPKNFQWMVVRGSLLPLKAGTAYSYIEAERLAKKAKEALELKAKAKA